MIVFRATSLVFAQKRGGMSEFLQRIVPLRTICEKGNLLHMYTTMLLPEMIRINHIIESVYLKRPVALEFFIPAHLLGNERLNLLLLNDGQDVEGLELETTLNQLYGTFKIEPVVVVAIKAGEDRIQEYGVAGMPDFMGRGGNASAYTDFVMKELVPFIEPQLPMPITGRKAFAGCSLGGLTAFDIAWNHFDYFDVTGVFSGSFWWRKKDLKEGYTDADRILHQMIKDCTFKPALKFWLMTGTEDETADRNRNYIIDSIDDTIDVIKALLEKGFSRPDDIVYYEMVGGKHEISTWAKAMPAFLCWAFSRKSHLQG